MMKKIISLLVVLTMLVGGTTVFAADSNTPSKWAKTDVEAAISLGLVPERLQSDYQKAITREEFSELIVTTVFTKEKDDAKMEGNPNFWTVEQVLRQVELDIEFSDTKQEHVKIAYILGSVNGISDTLFAPNSLITRQEAATMLINTSHLANGINYRTKEKLNYSDFESIADWAKPAVQASSAIGLMWGVGSKFDYNGNFTREQSIATMLRLYKAPYFFALRGNVGAYAQYTELRYNVGKNYVNVNFQDDGIHGSLETDMYRNWHTHPLTTDSKDTFTMERAISLFAFGGEIKPVDFTGIVTHSVTGQTSKWDYGWATISTFNSDSVLKFEFNPIQGYMTQTAGYKYGYPFQAVTVTQIPN